MVNIIFIVAEGGVNKEGLEHGEKIEGARGWTGGPTLYPHFIMNSTSYINSSQQRRKERSLGPTQSNLNQRS